MSRPSHARGEHAGDEHISSLTAAYAVDALDDVERARVERHLEECETCRAEVRSFAETAARLADATAVTPPAGLRSQVLAEVSRTRQAAPVASRAPAMNRQGGVAARWMGVAAAVALVLAVAMGGVAWNATRSADRAEATAAAVQQVLSDPNRRVIDTSFGTGKGTVVISGDQVLVMGRGSAPGPDRAYQLWFIGRKARSAGLLEKGSSDSYWALAEGLRGGEAVGVTVEPAGGSAQPTSEPILLVSGEAG